MSSEANDTAIIWNPHTAAVLWKVGTGHRGPTAPSLIALRALASPPPFRDNWLLSQVQATLKLYITVRMEERRISGVLNMCKSGREHQLNKNKSSILCCLSWPESCSSEEKRWKRRLWSNKVFFLIKNAWCQSCHRNRGLCERAEHCTIKYCVLWKW